MDSVLASGRRSVVLLVALLLTLLAVALHGAPAARAGTEQVSIMMDDDQVIYTTDQQRMAVLQSMKRLGVDIVRATVLWSAVAARTKDPRSNHRFDPANPATYPRGNWINYDQLIKDAAKVGIGVYFNVTGPGPQWAMGKTNDPKLKKSFMPDPTQFGNFVQAVAKRYSGNYPHGAGKAGNLPRMSIWSIWNEPNWPGWLAPQVVYSHQLGQLLPYAPILYRRLFYSARAALDKTGHKQDLVMLGETQPLGSDAQNGSSPLRPGQFLRELFCVDHSLRALHGAAASARGCDIFSRHGPMQFSFYAHHPYTKSKPPTWVDSNPDSFTLGNIARLPRLLDAIAANTHRLPAGVPIFSTEMGYSTYPPNPYRGVPLATQAAWINESDYLAYHQPRLASMAQFEYRDSGPLKTAKRGTFAYWSTFQTGLAFANGKPKPSYTAYALPIWVQPSRGGKLELWAQVRFHKPPTDKDKLVFQFRPNGSSKWSNASDVLPVTNDRGFVDVVVPRSPYSGGGSFRAVWAGPVAPIFGVSREAPYP